MSDALPLPPRPTLEQYKKLAKDLQRACKAGSDNAIRSWGTRWVEHHWRKFREAKPECALTNMQFFVARVHGFASWPRFVKHIEALQRSDSPISRFERAADAIVSGDIETLRRLLRDHPDLVHERSTREHRSTLLHYVSANGVEDFRQKTPKNIVEVARVLLDAGAGVNAESDAYGGHSMALGLTATSWHPQQAGVQIPLMQLLLDRGAKLHGRDVRDCLANGRGEAAEFLASRGATVDFEAACGIGRVDIVKSLVRDANEQQTRDGFAWACEFGRTDVVKFLLDHGFDMNALLKHHGQTGLHWAALGGHAEVVRLFIDHGAPVDTVENTFGGTPLTWAIYGWGADDNRGDYYAVVARLVRAGAKLPADWFEGDDERERAARKMHSDPRMMAALRGEAPNAR